MAAGPNYGVAAVMQAAVMMTCIALCMHSLFAKKDEKYRVPSAMQVLCSTNILQLSVRPVDCLPCM